MALTLLQGEDQTRALTRHTGDTTRLTQTDLRVYLNRSYQQLRSWLIDACPELYLVTSSDQTVAAGAALALATVSATHERTHRVDWKLSDGSYRPMERADQLDPNNHQSGSYTFREEGGSLVFGPDTEFSGTVRVLYHASPAALADPSHTFAVPVVLEQPLIFLTAGLVALQDGDGAAAKKGWDDLANEILVGPDGRGGAKAQLRKRHGVHSHRAGLQTIVGY